MQACPHIEKCQQNITERGFYTCLGEQEVFEYNKCLEVNGIMDHEDLFKGEIRRLPREWDEDLKGDV